MIVDELVALKERSGMTNKQIAEASDIPLGTINRVMARQTDSPNFETVQKLVKAMGGSLDEICGITSKTAKPCETVSKELFDATVHYKDAEIFNWKKLAHIRGVALALIVGAILLILLMDMMHPGWGYFQT